MEIKAGTIIELLHEILQFRFMAQRKNDIEVHGLGCGEPANRLCFPGNGYLTDMARQQGLRLRLANNVKDRHNRDDCEQIYAKSPNHDFSFGS